MLPSEYRSAQYTVISPKNLLTSATPMARARKTKAGSYELTERQAQVLQTIRNFLFYHGFCPTRAEIGKAVGLKNQSGVDNHLHALARKGWLTLEHGRERAIRLLREGVPFYEPEHFCRDSGTLRTDDGPFTREPKWIQCSGLWEILGENPDLYMRIPSEEMDRAGLPKGGIVALRRSYDPPSAQAVEDGEVVAARIQDDVVLARYHRLDERTVELRPESNNPNLEPLRFDTRTDDMEVIGVVIGRVLAGAG